MKVVRILRNPACTGASVGIARCRTIIRSDHGRTLASVAHGEPKALHEPRRVSVLLQKAVSLLPRTLSAADNARGPDSSLFWSNILERSITELSSGSFQVPLTAAIAVCSSDKRASSQELVTALLEDPFASDPTYRDILRSRWKNAPSYVSIKHGKPAAFAGELSSPSNWLQQFPHPVRLAELPSLSSLSGIVDETDSFLLSSDVLLLLCDPVITPLSDLVVRTKHLLDRPNTILILTSGSTSDAHFQFVSRTLSDMGCLPGHILFVDPRRALDAVTALQASPTSPPTIDRYQRDILDSRISTIAVAINEILAPRNPSQTSVLNFRQETALSQVHCSISASFRSIETTRRDLGHAASKIGDLLSRVQRTREDTKRVIFGKPGEDSQIEEALSMGRKEMNTFLGSLSFWKMVWRIDEIGVLVSTAVQGQWCKGLENQLILQTGCLEIIRRELTSSAFSLLSGSPFHSPVLENQLQQLTHSPTRTLTPSSLTRPIHDRQNQLTQHTTAKLHREAQSAVVGALSGVLGGAGLGWWLAFGGLVTEMGTAIGSGVLLAVGSIRWAVGKWERAKQSWAQDSNRIGDGLTRDLRSTVQRTLDDDVTIAASTACRGMQDLVDRRQNEINRLHGEWSDLVTELRAFVPFASRTEPSLSSVKRLDIE